MPIILKAIKFKIPETGSEGMITLASGIVEDDSLVSSCWLHLTFHARDYITTEKADITNKEMVCHYLKPLGE